MAISLSKLGDKLDNMVSPAIRQSRQCRRTWQSWRSRQSRKSRRSCSASAISAMSAVSTVLEILVMLGQARRTFGANPGRSGNLPRQSRSSGQVPGMLRPGSASSAGSRQTRGKLGAGSGQARQGRQTRSRQCRQALALAWAWFQDGKLCDRGSHGPTLEILVVGLRLGHDVSEAQAWAQAQAHHLRNS